MKTVNRATVLNFWNRELSSGRETYKDDSGEKDYTKMGEQAAIEFGVESDMGNTPIEQDIFNWALELNF